MSKSVSSDGVVKVGQIWVDTPRPHLPSPRQIKITKIETGFRTARDYAIFEVVVAGYSSAGSLLYSPKGNSGCSSIELFSGARQRYHLVFDVPESNPVRVGQVYRDCTRMELTPRLIRVTGFDRDGDVLATVTRAGYSRFSNTWMDRGEDSVIHPNRFQPGPLKMFELVSDPTDGEKAPGTPAPKFETPEPPFMVQLQSVSGNVAEFQVATGVMVIAKNLSRGYANLISKLLNEHFSTKAQDNFTRPSAPLIDSGWSGIRVNGVPIKQRTYVRPTLNWDMATNGTVNTAKAETTTFAAMAPDYVAFFQFLQASYKPEGRNLSIHELNLLLAAWDAGRVHGMAVKP